MAKSYLSVGELAKRSGVSISALHFYERKGLIRPERNAANHRIFHRSVLRRLAVIQIAQRAGFTLRNVEEVLDQLPPSQLITAADWERLATVWQAELDDRIELISKLRDNLGRCIGCGCLSVADCPLLNEDDQLASQGPGARLFESAR